MNRILCKRNKCSVVNGYPFSGSVPLFLGISIEILVTTLMSVFALCWNTMAKNCFDDELLGKIMPVSECSCRWIVCEAWDLFGVCRLYSKVKAFVPVMNACHIFSPWSKKYRSPNIIWLCSSITVRVDITIFCYNVRTTNVIQQITVCAWNVHQKLWHKHEDEYATVPTAVSMMRWSSSSHARSRSSSMSLTWCLARGLSCCSQPLTSSDIS